MADANSETRNLTRAEIESIQDSFERLNVIMKRLLAPDGCPWDREQTHQTLRQYFIEEVYEAVEAIDNEDDELLQEELGDVGLQVVFHAALAEQRGAFDIQDVYAGISKKLLDRHPHVFGDITAENSAEVLRNWEQLKKLEKTKKAEARGEAHASILSGVPRHLPALQRASRLQEKASRVGFDWEKPENVAAKVREEVDEFLDEAAKGPAATESLTEEFGDLLFSLVNLARFLDLRPEEALETACRKFQTRFSSIESLAHEEGRELKDMTLAEMDKLWDQVKTTESH